MRAFTTIAAVVVIAAGLAYALAHPPAAMVTGKIDLDAFYCAGKTFVAGADPYRYGAMHACETANLAPEVPEAAVPAPFPPYAIVGFATLAKLSFAQAALLWELLMIAAAFTIVVVAVEFTGFPLWLVGTCTLVPVLAQTVAFGALAPIPIALLCGAALAVRKKRWTLAAACIGVSCIEPHLALPVILATLALLPEMRVRLACVVGVLLLASLAAGISLNVEYVRDVLPAHAASELGTAGQFSLSAALFALGLSARAALALGSLQYAAFAIFGMVAANALRRIETAVVVLVPMAFATIGGTFVHASQLLAVVPIAWLLSAKTRSAFAWAGLALVLIPWDFIVENKAFSATIAGIIVFALLAYHRKAVAGLTAGVAVTALLWAIVARQPTGSVHSVGAPPPDALTEAVWGALAAQTPPTTATQIAHGLTYLGAALLAYVAFRLAVQPQSVRPPADVTV